MKPILNKKIQVFFTNLQSFEGVLKSWEDDEVVLESLAGVSNIIIKNTKEILMWKQDKEQSQKTQEDNTKVKELVAIKKAKIQSEREEFANSLKNSKLPYKEKQNYELPSIFFKKPDTE